MKIRTYLVAATLMTIAAPAFAQVTATATATTAAKAPAAGQTVYDTTGTEVGRIEKVDANVAVVATGKNSVGLPLTSFAVGDKGPVIALTRDQLDSAAVNAAAKITAGASVKDTTGAAVGTIKSIDGEYALLDTSNVQVKLPLKAFSSQPDGLVVGMSKAQIEAAAAASAKTAVPAAK